MTDYTTIRVTEAAKDEAEDSKRDDETWNDYLRRCTDNPPETREFVAIDDVEDAADAEEIAARFAEVFDYAALANQTADEIKGRMR